MSAEKINAITPSEVENQLDNDIPSELLESFNEIITRKYRDGYATVYLKDVVELATKKGLKKDEVFSSQWLYNFSIEKIYRKAGWKVEYDGPAYNESYEPYYQFSRRQNLD